MRIESKAKKIAQALWDLSVGENSLEIEEELQEASKALISHPELKEALTSRKVLPEKKELLFSRTFRGKVSPLVYGFLILLIEVGQIDQLPLIIAEYSRVEKKITAEVVTAQPIDEDLKAKVVKALSKLTGKEVVLKCKVDEKIIGGIKIRVGDKLIDGSLQARLTEAKLAIASKE